MKTCPHSPATGGTVSVVSSPVVLQCPLQNYKLNFLWMLLCVHVSTLMFHLFSLTVCEFWCFYFLKSELYKTVSRTIKYNSEALKLS